MSARVLCFFVLCAVALVHAFHGIVRSRLGRVGPLGGFMDALAKGLANEKLPPPENPGGKVAEPVVIEFLPSKKQIKAYPGQKLSMIAQTAGERIKYSCKKGECATCEVNFNGKIVKACQATLPTVGLAKKYTITIPQK
jgi:ferredoxin